MKSEIQMFHELLYKLDELPQLPRDIGQEGSAAQFTAEGQNLIGNAPIHAPGAGHVEGGHGHLDLGVDRICRN